MTSRQAKHAASVYRVEKRGTALLGQGPQCIIFSAIDGRRQNYELNFRDLCIFIACGLILLPPELFRILIRCKIVHSSIKFKFVHKISVMQEKFLVYLPGPRAGYNAFGAGSGPRAAGFASLE